MRLLPAILVALLLAGCAEAPPPDKPPRTVLVHTVADGEAAALNIYAGDVRARFESDLAFRIGGKVVERKVDAGMHVRRGDVIMRLDPQDVRLEADAARAQLAAAQADLALADAEFRRSADLHAANFISQSALDARRTALSAAQARLQQARAQAEVAGNQAGYAILRAEHDGVVTAALVEAGQVVSAGQAVLRIARRDEREVLIHVPEHRIGNYSVGQPVVVRPWSDPDRNLAAAVREIAPAADMATRTFAVRVSVRETDTALSLGSTANVVFLSARDPGVLLPLPAVTEVDGRPAVWVVDGASRVRAAEVEIQSMREDGVVIRPGLPHGTQVVVAGVHKLVAGELVRAVADKAPVALDVVR